MSTLNEWHQRQLNQKSGAEMDRRVAKPVDGARIQPAFVASACKFAAGNPSGEQS